VGAAYRPIPSVSVGLTVNAMYASLEYSFAASTGIPSRDMSTAYGLGATLGVAWKPATWATVGAAYETRSRFSSFAFNVPSHQVTVNGTPVTVPGGVEKMRFDHPPVATVGGSVTPLDGLVVAADLELIRWSDTQGKGQPAITSNPAQTGASSFDCNWSDQWVVKLGAQYQAAEWLALRAGWNYGKNPLDASRGLENIAFGANAEHHITGGLGVRVGKTTVNLGAWYAPGVKVSGSNLAQGLASYRTKITEHGFDAAVSVPL
jgi:long-chain fatty acid transport protein